MIQTLLTTNYHKIMKTELVQAYVAKKVAACHPGLAFARETMDRKEYHRMVLEKEIGYFDPNVLDKVKKVIMHRFGIKEHSMMFHNPTLRQWITNITGTWKKEDILVYIAKFSYLDIDQLNKTPIGNRNVFCNPFIDFIDVMISLENITDKTLGYWSLKTPKKHPYFHLDNDITYGEIAEYFSYEGNAPRINEKMKAISR
jgi:hypothetical protein